MLHRLGLSVLLALSPCLQADTSRSDELLTAMQQAMTNLNYQGTLAILKNGKLDTSRYFHSKQNGVEQERLVSLNSPLREVVREHDRVSCLFKATQELVVDHKPASHAFLLNLPLDLKKLASNYEFSVGEPSEVALEDTDLVVITPKDQYRHTRKIWLSRKHKLPLKIEVLDFTGTTLEQIQFTDISVEKSLSLNDVKQEAKNVKHIHEFENLGLEKIPFRFDNIPPGFEKKSYTRTKMPIDDHSVDQLLLSDGLSSISVYLDEAQRSPHSGMQSAGAINSYSHMIGKLHVTVIGDVPGVTVENLAKSVQIQSAP